MRRSSRSASFWARRKATRHAGSVDGMEADLPFSSPRRRLTARSAYGLGRSTGGPGARLLIASTGRARYCVSNNLVSEAVGKTVEPADEPLDFLDEAPALGQ